MAARALRDKMQDLISELSQLLSGSDVRWRRFGLNIPDAAEAPEEPRNLSVDAGIAGKLLVSCDPAVNATHYRFWKQVAGTDTHPVPVGTAQEPQFLIEGLTPGVAVKVFVSAANAGGESNLSAFVQATPWRRRRRSGHARKSFRVRLHPSRPVPPRGTGLFLLGWRGIARLHLRSRLSRRIVSTP